jgi:hypothetical protein
MPASLFTLTLLLAQVPAVPIPCLPSDGSVVCTCKQGMASACAALAGEDEETLRGILRAAASVKAAQEAKKAQEKDKTAVDTGCGSGQDPNGDDGKQKCTGQAHHIISKMVFEALQRHSVLSGLYRYRDSRFVARAKDAEAHCGYQHWHIDLDEEIADWLRTNAEATAQQFEAYLRQVYARSELLARFPNGF